MGRSEANAGRRACSAMIRSNAQKRNCKLLMAVYTYVYVYIYVYIYTVYIYVRRMYVYIYVHRNVTGSPVRQRHSLEASPSSWGLPGLGAEVSVPREPKMA